MLKMLIYLQQTTLDSNFCCCFFFFFFFFFFVLLRLFRCNAKSYFLWKIIQKRSECLLLNVCLTHFCLVDSSTKTHWTGLFTKAGCLVSFINTILYSLVIPVLNANSVDSDQTPRSAASDLGLRFLPMSLLWDARHNFFCFVFFYLRVKTDFNITWTVKLVTILSLCGMLKKICLHAEYVWNWYSVSVQTLSVALYGTTTTRDRTWTLWPASPLRPKDRRSHWNVDIRTEKSGNVLPNMCAQRRFRSDCAFAQSDQNLPWVHFG